MVLAINTTESKRGYRRFVDAHDYASLVWVWDRWGKIAKAYRVQALPTTFLLDKEGTIRYVHLNYKEGMEETFAQEIELLLE